MWFSSLQMSTTNLRKNELRQSREFVISLNSLYSPFVKQIIQALNHALFFKL